MKPVLSVKSIEHDDFLELILECIGSINCKEYFSNHLGKTSPEQKVIVQSFQQDVYSNLANAFPSVQWQQEHSPSSSNRDAIDIFGENSDAIIVIELDKNRADQVAKKYVSRIAILPNKKLYFVSLCYPGTERMNLSECIKYFRYCANLSVRIGNVIYAGFVIK